MRASRTLPASYFENKYRADIDPWNFRTSAYEREKYAATVGAIRKPRPRNALEVGCSIGVLTKLIAQRCDRVLALDGSETAIKEARSQNLPNVAFSVASLPNDFPNERFDLIVLSEVLYYFSVADLTALASRCGAALEDDGEIILCHWLGETDYPLAGRQASDLFTQALAYQLRVLEIRHEAEYFLVRLSATPL